MLTVDIIDSLDKPVRRLDGYTVVVSDQCGNPLAVFQELSDGLTVISTIKDGDDFQRTTEALGFNKLEIKQVDPSPVPPGEVKLSQLSPPKKPLQRAAE